MLGRGRRLPASAFLPLRRQERSRVDLRALAEPGFFIRAAIAALRPFALDGMVLFRQVPHAIVIETVAGEMAFPDVLVLFERKRRRAACASAGLVHFRSVVDR